MSFKFNVTKRTEVKDLAELGIVVDSAVKFVTNGQNRPVGRIRARFVSNNKSEQITLAHLNLAVWVSQSGKEYTFSEYQVEKYQTFNKQTQQKVDQKRVAVRLEDHTCWALVDHWRANGKIWEDRSQLRTDAEALADGAVIATQKTDATEDAEVPFA